MHRGMIRTAAILGAVSVALGAFAAHRLKEILSEYSIGIFETGVRYQFYHVFALALAGILYERSRKNVMSWAGKFFIAGIILFSGSLYVLSWVQTFDIKGMGWLGPVTPLGGACFITGWILLFLGVMPSEKK